jgi:hypothetical protein
MGSALVYRWCAWLSIFVLHALFVALQEEDEEDYGEESAFII